VRGAPLYMDGAGGFATSQMMGWFQLAEVVRNGAPIVDVRDDAARAGFFAMLVRVIFPAGFAAAQAAVSSMPASTRSRIKEVLDVGAGAAAWSIPFAQANKTARVTVIDLTEVTPIAREYTTRFGVGDRYEYRDGDLHQVDLGNGRYDLVILGHIIHGEGGEGGRRLIGRCAEALRERGKLLIAEFVPNEDRTGPALPMLFGLNMMLHTPAGDVFTMKEYRQWLKEAGFRTIKTIRTPVAASPLILATK
jgi:2-polyprenyl-3-methyl-5-hydroxy-6-metoxy-1,4-benzoquinol methylase